MCIPDTASILFEADSHPERFYKEPLPEELLSKWRSFIEEVRIVFGQVGVDEYERLNNTVRIFRDSAEFRALSEVKNLELGQLIARHPVLIEVYSLHDSRIKRRTGEDDPVYTEPAVNYADFEEED